MGKIGNARIRRGEPSDAPAIGKLLFEFNREFDEPTRQPDALAKRLCERMASGETVVLLAGEEPQGLADELLLRARACEESAWRTATG